MPTWMTRAAGGKATVDDADRATHALRRYFRGVESSPACSGADFTTFGDNPENLVVADDLMLTLADARARSVNARGVSKNAAREWAARRWLEIYTPERLPASAPRPSAPRPAPRFMVAGPAHERGVERAMLILGIPAAGHGVTSEALILPSWAAENPHQVRTHHQRDHRALAAVGSRVLAYEYAMLRLQGRDASVFGDIELSQPSRHMSAQATRQLVLPEGILSGRGEPVAGLSDSTLENVRSREHRTRRGHHQRRQRGISDGRSGNVYIANEVGRSITTISRSGENWAVTHTTALDFAPSTVGVDGSGTVHATADRPRFASVCGPVSVARPSWQGTVDERQGVSSGTAGRARR